MNYLLWGSPVVLRLNFALLRCWFLEAAVIANKLPMLARNRSPSLGVTEWLLRG